MQGKSYKTLSNTSLSIYENVSINNQRASVDDTNVNTALSKAYNDTNENSVIIEMENINDKIVKYFPISYIMHHSIGIIIFSLLLIIVEIYLSANLSTFNLKMLLDTGYGISIGLFYIAIGVLTVIIGK